MKEFRKVQLKEKHTTKISHFSPVAKHMLIKCTSNSEPFLVDNK